MTASFNSLCQSSISKERDANTDFKLSSVSLVILMFMLCFISPTAGLRMSLQAAFLSQKKERWQKGTGGQ